MLGAWLMVTSTSEGGSGLGLNPYLAILVVIGTGALVGAINGFFVVGSQSRHSVMLRESRLTPRGSLRVSTVPELKNKNVYYD